MKNKLFISTLFMTLFLVYTGCNSPIYEIVEVEEPVVEVPKKVDESGKTEETSKVDESITEIKEEVKSPVSEIKEESKPNDNKFSEKQVVSRSYAIQLGAYIDESNAQKCNNRANRKLSRNDIILKNIDGLYKIRFGNFSSKEEAINFLSVTMGAGFYDSFVVEVTTLKPENK